MGILQQSSFSSSLLMQKNQNAWNEHNARGKDAIIRAI
jgi:hypothetical protein